MLSSWNVNSTDKPPHCYATLIYMAMRGKDKVTLGEIYDFVKSNFKYYKANDNGWKNSIRHNLTQHNCFIKVQRTDEHPGKGGFWTLSSDHGVMFKNGIFKRKRRKIPPTANSHKACKVGKTGAGKSRHKSSSSKDSVPTLTKPSGGLRKRPVFICTDKRASATATMTGLLDLSDVIPDAKNSVLDGIDWDALVPDLPAGSGSDEGVDDDFSTAPSMMGALDLMEAGADSGMSIMPDINQNDGKTTPPVGLELDDLHSGFTRDVKPLMTVTQQLQAVESKLDLSGNIQALSDDSESTWSGEDLTVVGTGLTLEDGMVPTMASRDYNHVLLTDLDHQDHLGIPSDWMI